MKVLILLILHIVFAASQEDVLTEKVEPVSRPAPVFPIEEAPQSFCLIGTIALPPVHPKPACFNPNEIYACAFAEARCDGLGFCGTPPCHWRCWCKNGWKRSTNGQCVKICKAIAFPFPIEANL